MTEMPLRVAGSGAVTSVGFNSLASSAALRCRLNCFEEMAGEDGPLVAAAVRDDQLPADAARSQQLGIWMAQACEQAFDGFPIDAHRVPVLACLMEPERAGHTQNWAHAVVQAFAQKHGTPHPDSRTFSGGALAIVEALTQCRHLLHAGGHDAVLLAAADSWLLDDTLRALQASNRCLGDHTPDGMVVGEAAAALLLTRAADEPEAEALYIGGWAQTVEAARLDNDMPNLARGLCAALRGALAQAGQDASNTDLLLAEMAGPESFYADEAVTAALRTFQGAARAPETWLTAESLGATGAAAPLVAACWLREAHLRDYHPGFNSIWHAAADDGRRAAIAFTWL